MALKDIFKNVKKMLKTPELLSLCLEWVSLNISSNTLSTRLQSRDAEEQTTQKHSADSEDKSRHEASERKCTNLCTYDS